MRIPNHVIDQIFLDRWSSRAMSGEPLSRATLMQLFEAARWAPSSGNLQPWQFIYAIADSDHFSCRFDLLSEGNKIWCNRAGALVLLTSRTVSDGGRSLLTHSFDAGAEWMSFALQGSRMGLVVHAMAGFDSSQARVVLGIPDYYHVDAMIAVGYSGKISDLPPTYQQREVPSGRRELALTVHEGHFDTSRSEPNEF